MPTPIDAPGSGSSPPEKVRVLFLASNPSDMTRLAVGEEYREIDERLRASDGRDCFEITYAPEVRPEDLSQALQRHRPHVVHFSGHGSKSGELVMPDAAGQATAAPFAPVVEIFRILAGDLGIRCVLLNACYSEALAVALAAHVECVIGMTAAVEDRAAIAFAGAFYEALAFGRTLDAAYGLACAQFALATPTDEAPPRLHARPGARLDAVRLSARVEAPAVSERVSEAQVRPSRVPGALKRFFLAMKVTPHGCTATLAFGVLLAFGTMVALRSLRTDDPNEEAGNTPETNTGPNRTDTGKITPNTNRNVAVSPPQRPHDPLDGAVEMRVADAGASNTAHVNAHSVDDYCRTSPGRINPSTGVRCPRRTDASPRGASATPPR